MPENCAGWWKNLIQSRLCVVRLSDEVAIPREGVSPKRGIWHRVLLLARSKSEAIPLDFALRAPPEMTRTAGRRFSCFSV